MRALVVYESMYGNTHSVAVSIAAGLSTRHDVTLVPVTRATPELVAAADLLVVGGPTHMHGMSHAGSRRMAADAARKEGSELTMDPDADGPALSETIIASTNGSAFHVTAAMEVLPTLHPTKRHVPTGGVLTPMQRFAIMITPK